MNLLLALLIDDRTLAAQLRRGKMLICHRWSMWQAVIRRRLGGAMAVRTKRWDEPCEAGDGLRVLVTRYRPRGLPKEDETWDIWLPDLGPSPELHAAFYGKRGLPISWAVYRAKYIREMQTRRDLIADLANRVREGTAITLLCSSACIREERCHRSLLRDLVVQRASVGQ